MEFSNFKTLGVAGLLAAGTFLVGAPAAAAQGDEDPDDCICIDRVGDAADLMGRAFFRANRARIGILMGDAVEVGGHMGVQVEDVTPDAPAEAAGLEAGDVITAINGRELGDPPNEGLRDAMRDVDPGDSIELTYYRDGERRTAALITDVMQGVTVWSGDGDGFDVRVAPNLRLERLRDRAGNLRVGTPELLFGHLGAAGLELVELNEGLGAYFGTAEGVLVVDIDDDSGLGLQAGDVILSIDGRQVRDPGHAHSILRSYRPDEEIRFQVVRRDRRTEVTGVMH